MIRYAWNLSEKSAGRPAIAWNGPNGAGSKAQKDGPQGRARRLLDHDDGTARQAVPEPTLFAVFGQESWLDLT